jgi:hypothetical protein
MTACAEISTNQNVLEVQLTGKLTREFYEQFVPEVERQIQQFGKLRILLELNEFHGWTAGALWEDLKFDFRHGQDIERLAIVGEQQWQKGMAAFCKPFTAATVKYFDQSKIDSARRWIETA